MADKTSTNVDAEAKDGWVEGHARAAEERGIDSYFKVPLFTQIRDNLWMGGTPADSTNTGCLYEVTARIVDGCKEIDQHPRFKAILNLAPYWPYEVPKSTLYREVELYDSADGLPSVDALTDLAVWVIDKLDDGPALIHCQAGLNRSGLVTAFILMILGKSGQDAIDLLREKRCNLVLCNETFEKFLLSPIIIEGCEF